MQGSQKEQAVKDVRRSARKALSRLSKTFIEWESLIAGLKADVADQEKATDALQAEIEDLPSHDQVEELSTKIGDLKDSVDEQRRVASENADNRDNWQEESVRLQQQLRAKNKEISELEVELKRLRKKTAAEKAAELGVLEDQLEAEKKKVDDRLSQIDGLRMELREQRDQKAGLESKVEELLSQVSKQSDDGEPVDQEELSRLRKELDRASENLSRLGKIEEDYWESEKKVHELRKAAESREAANQALKNSVDSLREHKVDAKHQIEKLNRRVEEMKVAAKMAKAREAQVRTQFEGSGTEAPATSDTMRLSAAASQEMRLRAQNQELRDKLSAQRKELDEYGQKMSSGEERLEELQSSNKAQQTLIEELQKDVDDNSRYRGVSRKKDLEIAQLRSDLERKQELIDSLQIEILNLQSKGTETAPVQMVNPDATQAYKLDESESARIKAAKAARDEPDNEAAELREQLGEKDAAIVNLRKTITELRNRYQDLANREKSGKTIPMLKVLDRKSMPASEADESGVEDTASETATKKKIGATAVMPRPDIEN